MLIRAVQQAPNNGACLIEFAREPTQNEDGLLPAAGPVDAPALGFGFSVVLGRPPYSQSSRAAPARTGSCFAQRRPRWALRVSTFFAASRTRAASSDPCSASCTSTL